MQNAQIPNVQLIALDMIDVINPRTRNKKIFAEIVDNIAEIGLKKPITVAKRDTLDGVRYDLVCGQGRLEAYRTLGEDKIPAIIVEADIETGLIMSLVENLARRQHRAVDLLHDIGGLKQRGYSESEIAKKTGLRADYVRGVTRLLERGETRLLVAVEAGQVPVSIAVQIAEADDAQVQTVLQQAYESNALRGKRLMAVKRLIEQRRQRGKTLKARTASKERTPTVGSLLKAYREDTDKKRLLVRKADATRDALVFIVEALRSLYADKAFKDVLKAEGLDTLPATIAERIEARKVA